MACRFLTGIIATHVSIVTSITSTSPRGLASQASGMLPYRCLLPKKQTTRSFGNALKPRYIFGAEPLDQ
jgi:hypothetical protein